MSGPSLADPARCQSIRDLGADGGGRTDVHAGPSGSIEPVAGSRAPSGLCRYHAVGTPGWPLPSCPLWQRRSPLARAGAPPLSGDGRLSRSQRGALRREAGCPSWIRSPGEPSRDATGLAHAGQAVPGAAGGPNFFYEPKWDGFRCIVFRDGDEVVLGSRNERPLTRYFPELVESLRANLPDRCVLDGEVVIAGSSGLDFDVLSQRIHPAESRVEMLARTTPASFVAFDLLAVDKDDLRDQPFASRRRALEEALTAASPPVHLTPVTTDADIARDWFDRFEGAGLDGVVAKPGDLAYQVGKRVMIKVKHERTADCVVAGFRWHKEGGVVGSLLLGLFDGAGVLHHVGVASGFSAARRRTFLEDIAPYRDHAADHHPWIR